MSQNASVLYYRLREVDLDGKFIYSILVAVPIHQQGQPSISADPNPFDQTIRFKVINVIVTDKINKVSLLSIGGKRLYSENLGIIVPSTVLLQDLPKLRQGEYSRSNDKWKIIAVDTTESNSFVIQHSLLSTQ